MVAWFLLLSVASMAGLLALHFNRCKADFGPTHGKRLSNRLNAPADEEVGGTAVAAAA
jgi:hypothetical protein